MWTRCEDRRICNFVKILGGMDLGESFIGSCPDLYKSCPTFRFGTGSGRSGVFGRRGVAEKWMLLDGHPSMLVNYLRVLIHIPGKMFAFRSHALETFRNDFKKVSNPSNQVVGF